MSLKNEITNTPDGLRAWHQERTILETTDLMCEIMDNDGVTRSELANRLGKSKGYITQLLDGTTNMTLRTVSDAFLALGRQFHPSVSPLGESRDSDEPIISTVAVRHKTICAAPRIVLKLNEGVVNA